MTAGLDDVIAGSARETPMASIARRRRVGCQPPTLRDERLRSPAVRKEDSRRPAVRVAQRRRWVVDEIPDAADRVDLKICAGLGELLA